MEAFPLMRTKWSNEHIMAAVFGVLLLYLLPQWIKAPQSILSFIVTLVLGLFIDVGANVIRYRRPICAVSSAVTAAILQIFTPDISLWVRLIGISSALLIGKHLWGGAGKNIFNPAIVGLITVSLISPVSSTIFTFSYLLVPAMILSITFIRFRPFMCTGFIIGMTAALYSSGSLSFESFVTFGVLFWGCIVLTDPVTVTSHPIVGVIVGLMAGFLVLINSNTVIALAIGVLCINIISYIIEQFNFKSYRFLNLPPSKKESIPFLMGKTIFSDLTGEDIKSESKVQELTKEEILHRIKSNGVFGFGGAGFSAYEKVKAVI